MKTSNLNRSTELSNEIISRVESIGQYIIETGSTVRAAAPKFYVSKSTVHKDISERLEKINPSLWEEAKRILEYNKKVRHIRGGIATKKKYALKNK